IRAMFTAVGNYNNHQEDLGNKNWRTHNIKTVSNGEYQLRSGFRRAANQELIERNNANIQPSYDVLTQNPPTVPSSQGYLNYISALGRVHRKHRERRERSAASRKCALDVLANYVAGGIIKPDIQSTLKKSKAERKAERRLQVRTIRESLNQLQGAHIQPPPRDQRLVIAYGDADLRGTMKGSGPLPTKTFRRYLAQRAPVICVDEYNTSKICSGCHQRLFDIRRNDMSICNHRTTVTHDRWVRDSDGRTRHRRRRYCNLPDGTRIRTSQCEARVQLGDEDYRRLIYPIKICQNCLSVRNTPALHLDRDVNAACNMRQILLNYLNNLPRPPALDRGHLVVQ
ncbi:hypothetical protein BDC45DRAFT_532106, partial [Circinella umbellata]